MTEKHYDWSNGPDIIQQHSIAKHRILRSYLAAYYQTLVGHPGQEVLRLTLVDGFAGGGLYIHKDTRELVNGSPLILLEATREADFLINKERQKPIKLDVNYFFIESDRTACSHLKKILQEKGYASDFEKTIYLRNDRFQDQADSIIDFIKQKSPRNGRSIFVLDQYGYKDVPTKLIRNIFSSLPSAEVILTFGVDSFLNFASDGGLTSRLLDGVGVPDILHGRSINDIKSSDRDWRLWIQSQFYQGLISSCGAKHYTPFFIRNMKGHGDYWLIHMSQHHIARDVMTRVHWQNNNYFIHYGGSGLDMFQMVGYDPVYDARSRGQPELLGFEFDDVARKASVSALMEQIPRLIYANDEGSSFEALFATTCNHSPASGEIYREAIAQLIEHRTIEVVSPDGVKRRSAQQIRGNDQIISPDQKMLFV